MQDGHVFHPDVQGIPGYCIFCFEHRSTPTKTCSYGCPHEFWPEPLPKQTKKRDVQRCTQCGLHPKNPASSTNGCDHLYSNEDKAP